MNAKTWVDRYVVPAAAATTVVAWLALVVAFIPHLDGSGDAAQLIIAASSIPAALLGWRIVALDPGNVVGRRLVWLGLALTWVWVPIGLLELGAVKLDEPDALWVRILAIVNANHHVPLYLTLLAVVMVFPDGRAPSPAWRRRALAWNWFFAAALAFSLLDGGDLTIIGASDGPAIDSPLPVWKPAEIAGGVFMLILLGVMVATAIAVRGRFKRATGIERLQLSWLSYAASLVPLTIVVCVTEIIVTGGVGMATFVMGMLVTTAVPAAITVAVRRYRLYDIERLVNRTLVYVALTGTLGRPTPPSPSSWASRSAAEPRGARRSRRWWSSWPSGRRATGCSRSSTAASPAAGSKGCGSSRASSTTCAPGARSRSESARSSRRRSTTAAWRCSFACRPAAGTPTRAGGWPGCRRTGSASPRPSAVAIWSSA